MNLALFDFDGTISTRDSFVQFLQQAVGQVRFAVCMTMLLPRVTAYKLELYPNYRLKEDVLIRLFSDWPLERLQRHVREYDRNVLPGIIRAGAMERIAWHKKKGDAVVIVSASLEVILQPWCQRNDLALLATQLEVIDNRVTGRLKGRNCWGREKVHRVRSRYDLDEVDDIYAYGDSKGDRAMLEMASHSFYRPFH
jgi:HAD superfamily hydrolase (TIGR01490 family)